MSPDYDATLEALSKAQNQELSIIRLSEPILSAPTSSVKRSSNASADGAQESPSPASLAADLSHYKELFSKLRFSYLEQVTKEKFLRAIVGDPPQIVEHTENVALEAQLAAAKASLKAHKLEVAGMIDEIETRGRDLSERYEAVQLHTTRLRELPSQIVALEESLEGLREATRAADKDKNASLNMPLPATQALLMDRQKELEGLEKQLKSLQQAVPRKTQEAERMENELKPLEVQRAGTVSAAAEARRRREEGERGVGDELELKGRWYRSVETGIRNLVGMGA